MSKNLLRFGYATVLTINYNRQEKLNKDKIYIFFRENAFIIILLNILVIIISPWLFTRNLGWIDFTKTGEIGDTLGGITAPFINVLNAILIFLAFKEQRNANILLKSQVDFEKNKDIERLKRIRNLILYDLENRIKPNAEAIIPETKDCLDKLNDDGIKVSTDHVEFNDKVYLANNLTDYNLIFNKDNSDLKTLINIYSRVNFIFKHTPLQISRKYPMDRENMVFNGITEEEKTRVIERNKAKKKIELERLIPNLESLISAVEELIEKYK
ncbi:hypothetical protein BBFL7_00480 [Flavobacteria bacterium BBFL7]|nr:hypothetical protein BBFL7_00480 [Flavobacteria bacterium BBFL7]